MMEAVTLSETSVVIYQTTLRNIAEDSYFHNRHRENLIPQIQSSNPVNTEYSVWACLKHQIVVKIDLHTLS
jgi:hypothetical protein